jgi:hypothetical protein
VYNYRIMHVVTSGTAYLDIDAYGGCAAYVELLRLQGVDAIFASTAPLNESISPSLREWQVELVRDYAPSESDVFSIIDVANPDYFDHFVSLDRVVGIIDHHQGHETMWQERIGDKAIIVPIGAACTLVYEEWVRAGLYSKMSQTSARLLMCGVLDNTLNFGAVITSPRDRTAYEALRAIAGLPDDWQERYFTECQSSIMDDAAGAMNRDTKQIAFSSYPETLTVGQQLIWDFSAMPSNYVDDLVAAMPTDAPWFINCLVLSEGGSRIICADPEVKKWLSKTLGVEFDADLARANRLWLRKEIIKAAQAVHSVLD